MKAYYFNGGLLALVTKRTTFYVGVCLLGTAVGCSHRAARLEPPTLDSAAAASAAMAAHDTNGDAALDENELQTVPSLFAARADIDKDGNGIISQQELASRINFWQESRVAIMPAYCRVTAKNGLPLAGAKVTFEPEPFLGDALHMATGVTGTDGVASMTVAEEFRPSPRISGVCCGLYRVRISRMKNGKETVESRYNVDTMLGTEVVPNAVPNYFFRLTGD